MDVTNNEENVTHIDLGPILEGEGVGQGMVVVMPTVEAHYPNNGFVFVFSMIFDFGFVSFYLFSDNIMTTKTTTTQISPSFTSLGTSNKD